MPADLIAHTDPLALTALAFLAAILVITLGLFGWLIMQGGKGRKG
jgi:hypothetical protein